MQHDTPMVEGELGRVPRFLLALAAFGLLFLGSPGIASAEGSTVLAVSGIALWGAVASRPGRGAFLSEWLAGALGLTPIVWWIGYVSAPALVAWVGPGTGVYAALAGAALRRLARRVPLALAVPLAWIFAETLRAVIPPPLGLGWLRLGHYAHDHLWYSGGARVFGVQGLGFCLALVGGALAQVARRPVVRTLPLAVGALGIALPALCAVVTRPPATTDGPRLLLVQPGIPQQRKHSPGTWQELLEHGIAVTRAGLAASAAPPDLVCWGETMLTIPIAHRDLVSALAAGPVRDPEAAADRIVDPSYGERLLAFEREWVRGAILGVPSAGSPVDTLLPEGTRFLAGALEILARDGRLLERNSVFLWEPDGSRQPAVGKQHLVPGAETMHGLERFEWVRDLCERFVSYVPSLTPFESVGALTLAARDGQSFRFGVSVCFDNAFVDPFVDAVREHDVDFHLVLSNEAWYLDSCELDQMVAFTRLAAIATGRSIARATNSGVTLVMGADGRELDRLVVDGRDRLVGGALSSLVPVPIRPAAGPAPSPPFVRWRPLWLGAWILVPALLLGWCGKTSRNRGLERG